MTGRAVRNQSPGVPSPTSPSCHIGKVYFFFLRCRLTTGPCVLHWLLLAAFSDYKQSTCGAFVHRPTMTHGSVILHSVSPCSWSRTNIPRHEVRAPAPPPPTQLDSASVKNPVITLAPLENLQTLCGAHINMNGKKAKFTLRQATKAQQWSRDIPLWFL